MGRRKGGKNKSKNKAKEVVTAANEEVVKTDTASKKTRKKRQSKFHKTVKYGKLETIEKEWLYGRKFEVYKDYPKELTPKLEDVGAILEVAGYKNNDYFKLMGVSDKAVTVVDPNGASRTYSIDSVILHRNEKVRNSKLSTIDMMTKNTKKLTIVAKDVEENNAN